MKSAWQLTMRILGCTRVTPLLLMTLGITMGSSIALPIQQTESNILGRYMRKDYGNFERISE